MCLHLLLQGGVQGLELPRAFLRSLATAVSLASLFQGSRAGFMCDLEGRLGLRILKVALIVTEVDSHPQLAPLLHQPETFSLKARVDTRELFTKSVHRAHCLLEELVANYAPPALKLERSTHLVLLLRGCGWGAKWRTDVYYATFFL